LYLNYYKRILDILLVVLTFPVFVLLCLFVSILIKLDDDGSIFYQADRIGKDSKIFTMYKFRTMKMGAPHLLNPDGSTYNAEDDERVTKIGKFLRKTSLDELPQLINVLMGEMSFVGPRPSLAGALGTYQDDEIDKMKVRPGITGYTQAYFRNTISNREKRLNDAWYANNVSFWLDLKIIIRTIQTVVSREGLYTNQ